MFEMQRKESNMSLNSGDEPSTPLLSSRPLLDTRSKSSRLQHAVYRDIKGVVLPAEPEGHDTHVMLGTFRATAICGNDITGSCLYTAGLCVATAGPMGPICLAIIGIILYAFRSIYGEVVTAMPVNGGSYNALLNTTTKPIAATAACLSFLSYLATCVVSASSAVLYAQNFWAELPFKGPTVIVLAIFALLCAWGLKDSANVALAMFLLHILTMSILVVAGIVFIIRDDGRILRDNWHMPWPHILDNTTVVFRGTWFHALFFGVARGLLGITGFETSSNFVEEQLPGVFQKTLYWMWLAVTFFNPVLALLALGTCTWHELTQHQNDLLAFMGGRAINHGFRVFVAVDATIVLAGSVLTSYVGVTGLLRRMALDRCLPQWFLHCNKWRNTNQNIIFTFFVVSTSLFLALNGNIQTLSGVYTMAFLSVMTLFAIGCILLKMKRSKLRRDVHASYVHITVGIVLVVWGLLGNIIVSPRVLEFFVLYFVCVLFVVFCMFQRVRILKVMDRITPVSLTIIRRWIQRNLREVQSDTLVFLCKSPDLFVMNKAMLYIRDNEQTSHVAMVHVHKNHEDEVVMNAFKQNVVLLNRMYPKYVIDMIGIRGQFGPAMIRWITHHFGISTNMVFIACPSESFRHKFSALGGVRVITHHLTPQDAENVTASFGFGPLPPTEVIEMSQSSHTFPHLLSPSPQKAQLQDESPVDSPILTPASF